MHVNRIRNDRGSNLARVTHSPMPGLDLNGRVVQVYPTKWRTACIPGAPFATGTANVFQAAGAACPSVGGPGGGVGPVTDVASWVGAG